MITDRRPSHAATPLPLARRLAYASICILFSGLMACGDSDGPMDPGGNESQVAQIQVSLGTVSMLVGGQVTVTATALDGSGATVAATITWSSSDDGVATVNASGTIQGVGEGSAAITASAGGASATVGVSVTAELTDFMKDYVEAIFLGSGPLIPQDGFTACVTNPGRWTAFPRGTTLEVMASTTMDTGSDGADTQALVEAALSTVTEATLGEITATFATTTDPDPMPTAGQITATDHPDPQSTGCTFERGCVHVTWTDAEFTIMESSRTVLKEDIQPGDAYVHDVIGHGIMGMCHIDQELVGGNEMTLMAGGPGAFTGFIPDELSPLDIQAAQAVYGTDLEPGATRADFVARGLVRP